MIKKRETKFKFNLGDALIIILALLCICSVVHRALVVDDAPSVDYSSYTIGFEVDEREIPNVETYILKGRTIKIEGEDGFLDSGYFKGFIAKQSILEYTDNENAQDVDGSYGYISVKGVLIDSDRIQLENGIVLELNESYNFQSKYVQGKMKIVSIENDHKK